MRERESWGRLGEGEYFRWVEIGEDMREDEEIDKLQYIC